MHILKQVLQRNRSTQRRLKLRYWLVLLAAFLLCFTALSFISYLLIVFVCSRFLPVNWGFIGKIVLSFLLISCAVACIGGVAWLVKLDLYAWTVLSILSIILMFITALVTPKKSLPALLPGKKELLNRYDLLSLAATCGFIMLLLLPILPQPSAGNLGPLIMAGGDNSTHLNIIKIIDLNRGFAIGEENNVNLNGVLVAYPQGWHINAAFIKWMVDPTFVIQSSPTALLAFFYGFCVVWFGAFAFLLTRLGLWVKQEVDIILTSHSDMWSDVLVTILVGAGIITSMVTLFTYGFQTQLAAISLLLVSIIFIAQSYKETRAKARYSSLLIAGLALAGSSFSWLFLVPIGGLLLLIAFLHVWRKTKKLPFGFILGFIAVGLFIFYQPAVQFFIETPPLQDGVTTINLSGNIIETSIAIIIACVFLLAAYLKFFMKSSVIFVLLAVTLMALVFSMAIMAYQLNTVGELRYYYYKSTYTVIALIIVLLPASIGSLLNLALQSKNKNLKHSRHLVGGGAVISASLLLIAWLSPHSLALINRSYENGIQPVQAQAVANIIGHKASDATHIVSIGSCNRGDDIRATALASALAYEDTQKIGSYSYFELAFLSKEYLYNSIPNFVKKYDFPLIVLSNDQVISREFKSHLGDAAGDVRVIELDTTLETEPVTQCPDRIRTLTAAEIKNGIR